MFTEDKLNELLDHWEELVELGEQIDLNDICRDSPELLPEFCRRIKMLTSMNQLLSIDCLPSGSTTHPALAKQQQRSATEWELAISQIRAGRYQPVSFLAEGGLGRLFVARDTELNREVVLKLIKNETIADRETRRRFEFEAEITSQLDHPGIVPVYGFGRDERADGREFPYYAMRLIRGHRLEDAIRDVHSAGDSSVQYNVELQRLLRCFLTICETIAYAHSRGIIHRDLKPANIMIGEYGETLVVDWGLAKIVAKSSPTEPASGPVIQTGSNSTLERTQLGALKGTLAYMSPEQAMGQWDIVGPASDIYSLGAILYIILTGQKAFPDRVEFKIHQKVISGQFVSPRQITKRIPRALEQICLKAMRRDPAERYATATALSKDLERWLADEPVSAWREPWHYRLRRWCKRHSTALISTAAAMAVATMALGITASVLQKKNQQLLAANRLAESNFQQANQAVRDIVELAHGNPLLKKPGMRRAQESLLRVALEYYRDFVKQRSNDSRLTVEMLNARLAIARIIHDLRSPREAREEYESVLKDLDSVLKVRPSHPKHREQFAFVNSRLAQIDSELGEVEASRLHFANSDAAYQKLVEEIPDDSPLRLAFATAVFLQGDETNNLDLLQRARQLVNVADSSKNSVDAKLLLARICNQMGLLEMRTAQLSKAAQSLARAKELVENVDEKSMGANLWDCEALRHSISLNQGRVAKLQSDSATAILYFESARQGFEALVRQEPEISEYHLRLSTAYLELGKQSLANGEIEKALEQLSSARNELNSQPNTSLRMLDRFEMARSSLDLGEALLKAGRLEQSAEMLGQSREQSQSLVEIDPTNPDYHRNLAGAWNQIASVNLMSGDFEAGKAALLNAKQELALIADAHPDRPEFRNALAKVCLNLGLLYSSQNDWSAAWQWLKQARQIFESEVVDYPTMTGYQTDRIQFLQRLVEVYGEQHARKFDSSAGTGHQSEFAAATLEALDVLEKTSELTPSQKALREQLQTK